MSYQVRVHLPDNLKNNSSSSASTSSSSPSTSSSVSTLPEVGAVIMVGGAGGGLHGPASIYEEFGRRISSHPSLIGVQMDYRYPNQLKPCVEDVMKTCDTIIQRYNVKRVVLLGWSFGGAVVITAGALHPSVIGVMTVASQTAGTELVSELGGKNGKSLLLLHGLADNCLPPNCSRQLYARAHEPKELVLFKGDNHGLTLHRDEVMMRCERFALERLVVEKEKGELEEERYAKEKQGWREGEKEKDEHVVARAQ